MVCDYVVESCIVIEYIDDAKKKCKLYINCEREYYYLDELAEENIQEIQENIKREIRMNYLNKKIQENTFKKILFENDSWIDISYKKQYNKICNPKYITMSKIIKVYKDFKAIKK